MNNKHKKINNERKHTITIIAILATGLLMGPALVFGIDSDNLFEIGPAQEADILGDGIITNGPDWADLFDANGIPTNSFPAIAASFSMDQISVSSLTDDTTFAGGSGSNKNGDSITTWNWATGNVPAKDDMSNVYAYATTNPENNHLIIYSGFERLDPSGDSHIDIEFFQDQIALDEDIPCDVTPCDFVGNRTPGDLIISMDFIKGGSIGEVSIREWNGVDFDVIETLDTEGCNADDTACAFNNGGFIDGGPWPNLDRHGDIITDIEQNAFTEFGMDVTALLDETPCISSFMGKTRSSQSFTAELKDFTPPTEFNICSAFITISPDDVNEVNQPHTFTITANTKIGNVVSPADDGTIVTVDLTDANGATSNVSTDTCFSGIINGACDVTFTSDTTGTVTGHASAEITIGGTTFFVETDGIGSNSGDAVKRFVDAFITIEPDDINSIGESHTFTVSVNQDTGFGNGFTSVDDGTIVNVVLTDSNGAINSISSETCSTGTIGGICDVTFTSDTTGTVTGNATVTLLIDGVTLIRITDGAGNNSDDAIKEFVAGTLAWSKVDNAGMLQGGAIFEVCRTHDFNTETMLFDPITPECVDVTDDTDGVVGPGIDQDADAGEFLLVDLVLGRYTVDETVPPAGFAADPKIETAEITLANPDEIITESFHNQRPMIKITEFGYTNTPTGMPTQGIVSGITAYSINVKNFGGADALTTVSLVSSVPNGLDSGVFQYVSSAGPAGVIEPTSGSDCVVECTVVWSDLILAPNSEITFMVTVEYSTVPDDTEIDANLTTTYTTTTDGFERTASGSPALIAFTTQLD